MPEMSSQTNILNHEYLWLYGLYILAALISFSGITILSYAFFLLILYVCYRSRKDYFWLAFFVLIFNSPGYLFYEGLKVGSLPTFNLAGGLREINYSELVIVTLLVKAAWKGAKFKQLFNKLYVVVLIVFAFYLVISIPEMSTTKIFRTIRLAFPLSLFYSVSILFEGKYRFFIQLITPFLFFVISMQIFLYTTGTHFAFFFSSIDSVIATYQDVEHQLARPLYSVEYLMLMMAGSIFFIANENKTRFNYGTVQILILSSIFISATRGYVLGLLFMWFASTAFLRQQRSRLISISMIALLLLIAYLISVSPVISFQTRSSLQRILTLKDLAGGDITAGGTLQRLDKYMPVVLAKFSERPWFGWGFTETFFQFTNSHVAHANMLLNVGVVGYFLFFCMLVWFVYLVNASIGMRINKTITFIILGSYLLVHYSSYCYFTMIIGWGGGAYTVAIVVAMANYYLQHRPRIEVVSI